MNFSSLEKWFDLSKITEYIYLDKFLGSLVIILILWIVRYSILKVVNHQTNNESTRYSWRKATGYMFAFLLIVLIGRHWLNGLEPILAFLGIIAVGLTISLKEVVSNLAGIVVILWRDVFVVGDRIEISNYKGDVVGLGVMYFSILEIGHWVDAEQSTGRLIRVPNSLVISQPVINYTKSFPFIWDEISICITFDSDWKKARKVLQTIADEKVGDKTGEKAAAMQEMLKDNRDNLIHFRYLSPKIYMKPQQTSPAGIVLTLRYLCNPRERRGRENDLWEEILDQFHAEPEITICQ